jgi:tRNA (cmo5U34)-methyltransferase
MIPTNAASAGSFNRDAAEYDSMRRRLVPCFDAFYGAALDLIDDWRPPGKLRALDLGAGTGLFSAMLLARRPEAQVHLVDASEGMLTQARQRFSGADAVSFAVADIAAADLGGPWDLIISALAIHHLDDSAKKDLFRRVHAALADDGLFVNAEQALGPEPVAEARYARLWLKQIKELGAPPEQIAKAQERMAHDRCASVEDQMQWMRQAGLRDVDCSFKAWRFAVLSGRR